MRLKGVVPLSPLAAPRRCKCVLNAVNQAAHAFEIDLRAASGGGASQPPRKTRYVFICAGEEEAKAWLHALQRVARWLSGAAEVDQTSSEP